MKRKELFTYIDELFPRYVDLWEDICRIESPTAYKEGVDKVGEYLTNYAKTLGFDVLVHKEDVSGNALMISMNSMAKEPPIVLSAHMDTVHPLGSFGENVTRREGDRLYAPGAVDCKGGIAEALLVMHALSLAGFDKRPVKLLLQSDEEVGSRTSEKRTVRFMANMAEGCAAFLNLEGSSPGYAIIKRKGILYFTFKIKGIEAHSARCAKLGASAIREAAYKIIEIEKFKDDLGITCNVGTIKGGTVPNTVPGECEFCVNIRYSDEGEREFIESKMKELAEMSYVEGTKTELLKTGMRVSMPLCDKNRALLNRVNDIITEHGFPPLKEGRAVGGSDAADISSYGIPVLDSLGVTGGEVHTPFEFGDINSLSSLSKLIATVIYFF